MADQPLSSPRKAAYAVAALFSVLMVMHMLRGSETSTGGGQLPLPGKGGEPTFQRTIVAVGDLHGDYPNMMTVLKMAKVVSENGTWTGDVDYLVQTGDIVDRGDDTLKMYRYLEKLRVQAQQAGGDIRSHFGNHEVMNLIGDWRYVPQTEILTFGGVEARQQMLAKGWLAQAWRANYTITTRLPLHPSLGPINTDYDQGKAGRLQDISHAAVSFLHGGLSPTYEDLTPYPSRINGLGDSLVRKLQERRPLPPPHPPNQYPGLPMSATAAEHELYGGNGPLWYRGWAMDKDHVVCSKVDAVMQKLGVRHLVMGHTPNFTGIVSRCGGKILLIDTGISHAYGGVLSAARFTYTLTPTKRKGFWIESEVVTAIYEEKEEVLVDSEREIQADFI